MLGPCFFCKVDLDLPDTSFYHPSSCEKCFDRYKVHEIEKRAVFFPLHIYESTLWIICKKCEYEYQVPPKGTSTAVNPMCSRCEVARYEEKVKESRSNWHH